MKATYDLFGTDLLKLTESAVRVLDKTWKDAGCPPIYALFSGGKDSLAATHLASKHLGFAGCVHVNTGIGIQATRRFVRETCESQSWPLYELHPPNRTYDDMVLRKGFPGPNAHLYAYVWLKERALHAFTKARKTLLVSGVRSQESRRRMGKAKWVTQDAGRTWVAPILDWPVLAVRDYAKIVGLKQSLVSQHLHMSGECLCGAYAKPGERYLIDAFFPADGQRIKRLERRARRRGVHAVWGTPPPKKLNRYPEVMPEMFAPMCFDCEERGAP